MTDMTGQQKGAEANRKAALRRDAVVLRWLDEGATYADIASWLTVSVDSVRTVVYRARQRAGIRVRPYLRGE